MGLLRALIIYGIGFYSGVYATQNYDLPKMEEPQEILQKIKEYLKQYEKPPKKD